MSTDKKIDPQTKPTWHELAEQATQENDGEKLRQLVEQICDKIDAAQAEKKKPDLNAGADVPTVRGAI
jgi:hypothetical protein